MVFLPGSEGVENQHIEGIGKSSRAIQGNQAKVLDATELLSCYVN